MPEKRTMAPSGTYMRTFRSGSCGGRCEHASEENRGRVAGVGVAVGSTGNLRRGGTVPTAPSTGSTTEPTMPFSDGTRSSNSEPSEIMLDPRISTNAYATSKKMTCMNPHPENVSGNPSKTSALLVHVSLVQYCQSPGSPKADTSLVFGRESGAQRAEILSPRAHTSISVTVRCARDSNRGEQISTYV